MAKLLACIVAIICLLPVPADSFNWDKIIAKTRQAVLHIKSTEGDSCTGFVVGSKGQYVITDNHCLGNAMRIHGEEAAILSKSLTQDLALLRNDRQRERLKLSVDIQPTDLVILAGYAHAWVAPVFIEGFITGLRKTLSGFGSDFVMVWGANRQEVVYGGMSGGPVVNIKGDVVGIIQVGLNDDRVMGMRPSAAILDFIRIYEEGRK